MVAACVILTFYILLRNTRSSPEVSTPHSYSPPPIGTYDEVRRVLDWTEPQKPTETIKKAAQTAGSIPVKARPERPQIPLEDLRAHSLRKQLALIYPYDVEAKFPAYVWQTWKVSPGDGAFPEDYRPMEASWTVLHPTFVHEVITDDVASNLVRHLYASIPEVHKAYESLPAAVMKADFFRYLILLARGGIYSDIDTLALKSAVEWVPETVPRSSYGLVVGIEADPDRPDWQQWYSRRIQFCQWTIQSKSGHPVLVDIVATITEETLRRKKEGRLGTKVSKDIIEFTGPAVWTDALFRYFNDPRVFDMSNSTDEVGWRDFTNITAARHIGDVIVLPITSFSPGVGQMGAKEDDDPMAFVKHSFEGERKENNLMYLTDW